MENISIRDKWVNSSAELVCAVSGLSHDLAKQYIEKSFPELNNERVYNSRTLHMRNLFQRKSNDNTNLNGILPYIGDNSFILTANGTVFDSHENSFNPNYVLVDKYGKERGIFKKAMIHYEQINDSIMFLLNELRQGATKGKTNSLYGTMGRMGSFFYCYDTGDAVTSQCRFLVSDAIVAIERSIGNNFMLGSSSEAMAAIMSIVRDSKNPKICKLIDDFVDYYPSDKDIAEILVENFFNYRLKASREEIQREFNKFARIIFKLCQNRYFRTLLYYKTDFVSFISKNKIPYKLMHDISHGVEHIPIYDIDKDSSYRKAADILQVLIENIVYLRLNAWKRVEKFKDYNKKIILYSDTDSAFLYYSPLLEELNTILGYEEKELSSNENLAVKHINLVMYIADKIIHNIVCPGILEASNGPDCEKCRISMKNEFTMKFYIPLFGKKKNYVSYIIMREGKEIRKLDIKGTVVGGNSRSEIGNMCLQEILKHLIENNEANTNTIINIVILYIEKIKQAFTKGDIDLGRRFIFANKNYVNPWGTSTYRTAMIWNNFIEDKTDSIENGDSCVEFKTFIKNPQELKNTIGKRYPNVCDRLISVVYDNPHIAKYGLRSISIPVKLEQVPEYLLPIIDINSVIETVLGATFNILPSIAGVYPENIHNGGKTLKVLNGITNIAI